MKYIAAFWWNGSNKSISYMIINQHTKIIVKPKKYNLTGLDIKQFRQTVNNVILNFFGEILKIYETNAKCDIKIEYRIVHQVPSDQTTYYQPSYRSDYIRKKFRERYALTKARVLPLKLSQQLRAKLKNPELAIFKSNLKHLGLVKPYRDNGFEYHLWILANHATKANYLKTLNRLLRYHPPPTQNQTATKQSLQ